MTERERYEAQRGAWLRGERATHPAGRSGVERDTIPAMEGRGMWDTHPRAWRASEYAAGFLE